MILIQINYSDTGIGIGIPKFLSIPISSFDFLKKHDFFLTLTMGCCSLNKQAQATYIQTTVILYLPQVNIMAHRSLVTKPTHLQKSQNKSFYEETAEEKDVPPLLLS